MAARLRCLAATVILLSFCFGGAERALAQAQNLEAGKSPAQIFAQTCSACHKSPRGLVRTVPASSLPGFLRQHYTTSSDMAGWLASYLMANGAADPRYHTPPPARGRVDDRAYQQPQQAPSLLPEPFDFFRRGPSRPPEGVPMRAQVPDSRRHKPKQARPATAQEPRGAAHSGGKRGTGGKRDSGAAGDAGESLRDSVKDSPTDSPAGGSRSEAASPPPPPPPMASDAAAAHPPASP